MAFLLTWRSMLGSKALEAELCSAVSWGLFQVSPKLVGPWLVRSEAA